MKVKPNMAITLIGTRTPLGGERICAAPIRIAARAWYQALRHLSEASQFLANLIGPRRLKRQRCSTGYADATQASRFQ